MSKQAFHRASSDYAPPSDSTNASLSLKQKAVCSMKIGETPSQFKLASKVEDLFSHT